MTKLSLISGAALVMACSHQPPPSPSIAMQSEPRAPQQPAPSVTTPAGDSKLANIIAGAQRPDTERLRDPYRHPQQTLEFFGIKGSMKVVELNAGRGWYTAILGPFLNPEGALTVTAANPNGPDESEVTKAARDLSARLSTNPAVFSKVSILVADWKDPGVSLGQDGSADMVLTFRNMHNWMSSGVLDNVLRASFRVLKSGGTLGVVEHRAKPDASIDPKVIGETGYVPEAYAIQRVESAGFKLEKRAEINANPKDTKDYAKGVWTLPPTLRLGDTDRAKYEAIGESDRMTLKFRKP